MNIHSNFSSMSLRNILDALRRIFFPQPIPVRVEKKLSASVRSIVLLLTLALISTSCSKKEDSTSTTSEGTDGISLHAKPLSTSKSSGESAGGGSPLGQQMSAQKIVEDMSGATDIKAGRRAAAKIDEINASRNADFEEMNK